MTLFKRKRLSHFPDRAAFAGTSEPLEVVRLMVILNEARAFLRPSARLDLLRYIGHIRTPEELRELVRWGDEVLKANAEEKYFLLRPKTRAAVVATSLPLFREPDRAFKVRWQQLPRNLAAAARARSERTEVKRQQREDRRKPNR
jgi:hypothetical protein